MKAALVKLGRHAAAELARYQIRVNTIAPGWTATPRTCRCDLEQITAQIPLKRWTQPEEIGGIVLFYASDAAASIIGNCITVDGGATLVDAISNDTPLLVNVKPHGTNPVGAEFHNAGGVPAVMKELESRLNLTCMTVTGKTVGENLKDVDRAYDRSVIHSISDPISPVGGMCILKGNLAPDGCVVKRSAATERLLHHRGPAKVFDDLSAAEKWLADENSDVDENTVIVLRGYGPKGAPGMPEFGNYLPVPPKLHKKGIDDYLRVTDSRMSGGCFGSVILHVAPEAEVGGPLAAVRDGDIIHVEADENLIEVELSDSELRERLKDFRPKGHPDIRRGFIRSFIDHVQQANDGCDLDYLTRE